MEGFALILAVFAFLGLFALAGIVVSVGFSRRGDCEYARVVFREYMQYRTVAGPPLTPDELSALDHALVDSRDSKFVIELLQAMPSFGDRSSLHFIGQCVHGKGATAPAADDPSVREAAADCQIKLLARLDEDGKSAALLRAFNPSDHNELLRPALSGVKGDVDLLLRPGAQELIAGRREGEAE